tara:strand:+ start:3050 stop:3889 length:840 start_codon:yes stop_codon:yes gene_type:complete
MPTIDFISFTEETVRLVKPVLAKKAQPEWWKKSKIADITHGEIARTIRACPAMDDWLKSGWIIETLHDIDVIQGDNNGTFNSEFKVTTLPHHAIASPSHPETQLNNFLPYGLNDRIKSAFKIRQPWNIITPPGYSCLFLDPFLTNNTHFTVWQGIIDTDKFNVNNDNAQMIFYPKVNHSFTIKKGTALCQIIPYKREVWTATYQVHSSKSYIENRNKLTKNVENTSMEEFGKDSKYDTESALGGSSPYRREGQWQEKGKLYKENEPPPECPYHGKTEND